VLALLLRLCRLSGAQYFISPRSIIKPTVCSRKSKIQKSSHKAHKGAKKNKKTRLTAVAAGRAWNEGLAGFNNKNKSSN
jgi:hypothetical protein